MMALSKIFGPCSCVLALFFGFSVCQYANAGVEQSNSTTPSNPSVLLQTSIDALQADISEAGPANLAKDPAKLNAIMNKTVMPLVNMNQMAALALGPKWRTATPAQQQVFVKEFNLLLSKNYTNAILDISDYTITLYPLRGTAWQTEQNVAINGLITDKNNPQGSHITYYLERSQNSWQIYDIAVEGVSFLKNYQAQFQAFPDMPSLLAKLGAMNTAGS